MSVLIPGQGPLSSRACMEREKARLIIWFAKVEIRAWEWVNAVFRDPRPDKIFLVIGQTLTPEFAIAHQQERALDCEIMLEPFVGIPEIVKAKGILGYQFRNVSASLGFKLSPTVAAAGDPTLYSIFIEIFSSKVIRRIRFELHPTLSSRIDTAFASVPLLLYLAKPEGILRK